MSKKFKMITAIVLVALSVLSVVAPAIIVNATEIDNPLANYDTNMHLDLQDLNWHDNPTLKTCLISKVNYDTTYVDKNDIAYKLKVHGRTAEIEAVSAPVGTETIVIPRYVTMYRLMNTGLNDGTNADAIVKTENENLILHWNFSEYVNVKTDKEGNVTSITGPSVVAIKETVEITGITESFAENVITVKNVVLPNSIASIDKEGFINNPYIENIYGPGVLEVGQKSFYNCKSLQKAIFPKIKYVREQAFYKNISLEGFDFYKALSIEKEAFFDCTGITEINLPTTIQTLGQGAFKQCTNLKSVNLPKGISVNTIPAECFYLCSKLEKIDFPTDIITIGKKAFLNCDSLRVLDLRKTNISTIESQAFWGCIRLAYIVLPETLVSFKMDAFENCTLLRFIYFMAPLTDTQIKLISDSEVAKCTITKLDTEGPVLKDQTSKNITIYEPATYTAYDVVDVSEVYINNKLVDAKNVNYNGNGYLTYGKSFDITEEGTYKVTLVDLLGNKSYYTISYLEKPTEPSTQPEEPTTKPVTPKPEEPTTKPEEPTTKPVVKEAGDVDGDGKVSAADARLALRMSVALEKVDIKADVDKDGKISASDARLILRKSVGLEKF